MVLEKKGGIWREKPCIIMAEENAAAAEWNPMVPEVKLCGGKRITSQLLARERPPRDVYLSAWRFRLTSDWLLAVPTNDPAIRLFFSKLPPSRLSTSPQHSAIITRDRLLNSPRRREASSVIAEKKPHQHNDHIVPS